jgi:hypothetical protein
MWGSASIEDLIFSLNEFGVYSINTWRKYVGKKYYPSLDYILITADGGGSNGCWVKFWKQEL